MAEIPVIGWLVSPIIKEMISKLRSYLETQYNWNTSMKDDLKTLETTMAEILVMVSNAEMMEISNPHQEKLLQLMKEAVYEAENVLDKFDYLLLKANEESQNKVTSFVASSRDAGKRLLGLHPLRKNLSKALKSLERVKSSAKGFFDAAKLENTNQQPEIKPWRLTSCFPLGDTFIGRDKEFKEIIKTLVESSSNEAESSSSGGVAPIVLSITGHGGVGKTTLAQHIYNEELIKDKFNPRIWICVSDCFDEMKLTKEILASASETKNDYDITTFNFRKLQEELQKILDSKKYLLVFDDVWDDLNPKVGRSEIKNRWMKFLAPLKRNKMGSAILVTTCQSSMAEMLCSKEKEILYLQGLDGNDSWQLFISHAFPPDTEINTSKTKEIKNIGKQIVKKLKGLSLALKVVGEQLNGNYNVGEWKKVLRSDLSDDIMKVLKLSYDHLPRQLQQCFAYCSIFPKDWLFEPDRLVQMWIAQGFIYSQDGSNVTVEEIGRGYFADLCNKSFFQTFKRDGNTYYVMHDMMNNLALSVSRGECCRIESDNHGKIPPTVRHVSIVIDLTNKLESIVEMKNLRTLIVLSRLYNITEYQFKNLKSVRVLVFSIYFEGQLQKFDGLIHLRYLELQLLCESYLDNLFSLYHLKQVYFSGQYGLFNVQKKKGNKFGALKSMDGLHGGIKIKSLENIKSKEEAWEARLSSKEHINQLSLEFLLS